MKKLEYMTLKEECFNLKNEKMVFGEGNLNAKIVLVGEAPGAKEIEKGKPFVGQAGKYLDEFINILEIKREDIYITNTVKIRPYKFNEKTGRKVNRPPKKEEINEFKPILLKEIELIHPDIVVSLGNYSLKTISGKKNHAIGQVHGSPIKLANCILFPLYHPAAVIYNRNLKDTYYQDLQKLKAVLLQFTE